MDLVEHYRKLFIMHGDSPQAVQWSGLETQERRFQILCDIGNLDGKKILDLGCGTAHLATYLKQQDINVCYTGVDIVPEFLQCASNKHPEHRFCTLDKGLKDLYDYVFISGVFNNKIDDNRLFYQNLIKRSFAVAKIGLSFNMLSHYVDYYDEGLFYEQPETVFGYIKRSVSPYVTIRNDYQVKDGVIPFEFTVYVYKK